jgi:hypothetical protein
VDKSNRNPPSEQSPRDKKRKRIETSLSNTMNNDHTLSLLDSNNKSKGFPFQHKLLGLTIFQDKKDTYTSDIKDQGAGKKRG